MSTSPVLDANEGNVRSAWPSENTLSTSIRVSCASLRYFFAAASAHPTSLSGCACFGFQPDGGDRSGGSQSATLDFFGGGGAVGTGPSGSSAESVIALTMSWVSFWRSFGGIFAQLPYFT